MCWHFHFTVCFTFQIDFLNSVIVDMQRKNEELKTRLEAMESGGYINGTSDEINLDIRYFLQLVSTFLFSTFSMKFCSKISENFFFVRDQISSIDKFGSALKSKCNYLYDCTISALTVAINLHQDYSVIFVMYLIYMTRRTVRSRPCRTVHLPAYTTETDTSSDRTVIYVKVRPQFFFLFVGLHFISRNLNV